MSNNLKPVHLTDLQFVGDDDTAQKLRRLVPELIIAEKAVNALIKIVNAIQDVSSNVPKHVLADAQGLGVDHTTSGLTAGMVLRAASATTAAFARLTFQDLAQSDVHNPQNGDVLLFTGGYWTAAALPMVSTPANATGVEGQNLGLGTPIFVNGTIPQFHTLGAGPAISLTMADDEIVIGAKPFSSTAPGIVPAIPVPNHSQVLYGDGWGAAFDFPKALSIASMRM